MTFSITDWNTDPNRDWYIKLSEYDSSILVQLYKTESDAQGDNNLVASGSGEFGSNSSVLLTQALNGSPDISFFNIHLNYHLKVSGESGDSAKLFHLAPFTDLPEINDSIYRSESLIKRRAIKEINDHTHVINEKTTLLATLLDGIEINDTLQIDSSFRGTVTDNIVKEVNIIGNHKSMVSSIVSVQYLDFTKE